MAVLLTAFFFFAIITALVFFLLARVQRERTGLPLNARVVYSDTSDWKKLDKPLFSRRYGLTGKPDYIVEQNAMTIPIEVKPNRHAPVHAKNAGSSTPRESDVMQLAAYGLLIEEAFGAHPPYGLLKYHSGVFQIAFTDELRAQLLDLLDAMRADFRANDIARSHAESRRCHGCGYRDNCGQMLA